MPTPDDIDPIQDAEHARERSLISAPPPTLAELHRRWMHARLAHEQAERAVKAAHEAEQKANESLRAAVNPLAERLLANTSRGISSRQRRRRVAMAGEALDVYECGVDYPDEFGIEVIPLELVPLD